MHLIVNSSGLIGRTLGKANVTTSESSMLSRFDSNLFNSLAKLSIPGGEAPVFQRNPS